MRKATVLMLVMAMALLVGGCVRPVVNTKVLPLAYIDSVSPSEIYVGERIKFSGHGVSNVGQLITYNWRSNVNGDLSQLATFDTNTLTAGPHTIWFKVQDSYGNWSQEVGANVNVLTQGGPSKMSIKAFGASPPNINEGDWTTLTWDVAGMGDVRIDPDIGAVAQSGNRSVQPLQTKKYTIFATNDQGIASASMQVTVTPIQANTLEVYSIPAEDGTIRGNNVTFNEVFVGMDQLQNTMQGFLSFDVSSIPPNAIIKSVQLDLTKSQIINYPFPYLGSLLIYNQSYGIRMDANRNTIYLPNTPMFTWSYGFTATQMPDTYFTSPDMLKAVQTQVDLRSNRFQIKLQFEKYYNYQSPNYYYQTDKKYQFSSRLANYIDVGSGTPRLIVLYVLPN